MGDSYKMWRESQREKEAEKASEQQVSEKPVEKTVVEITNDDTGMKVVLNEMLKAINAGKKTRELALVATKIEEAVMWLEKHQAIN